MVAPGCGGERARKSFGDLEWATPPRVFTSPTLPDDRVLQGQLKNRSLRVMNLSAPDFKLLDARGRRVPGQGRFLAGYLHGLFPPTRLPKGGLPEAEKRRLGLIVRLKPGKRAPFNIAWRLRQGRRPPVRLDYGPGSLSIPAR
jgi:hypothetical protein